MYIVYHLVGAKSFDPDTFLKQQLKVRCKVEEFIYGGDYNPDQWLDEPQVLEDDIRMMKKAHINEVSLGIFSWALLEPEEGRFEFDWLADIIHKLYENGIYTILATPSGARPRWLAKKYPEVLRTYEDGKKAKFGGRHNHCLTSPAYREKVRIIDAKLAECFKDSGDELDRKKVKDAIKLADKGSQERKLLETCEKLFAEKAEKSKIQKQKEKELKEAVQERILLLTNEEIDTIMHEKWFGDVEEEMTRLIVLPLANEIEIVKELYDRYSDTLDDIENQISALTQQIEDFQKELVIVNE